MNELNELEYNAILRETAKEINRFQEKGRKINNSQGVIPSELHEYLTLKTPEDTRGNEFYRFI